MSCTACGLVGFFIARNGCFKAKDKKVSETDIDLEMVKKAERESKELYNMLTYDGTPQEEIKGY